MKSKSFKRCLRNTLPLVLAHSETKTWFFRRLFQLSPKLEPILLPNSSAEPQPCLLTHILLLLHQLCEDNLRVNSKTDELIADLLPEHYGYINKALIHTLHDILGSDFTDDVKEAWGTALNEVAAALMNDSEVVVSDRLQK